MRNRLKSGIFTFFILPTLLCSIKNVESQAFPLSDEEEILWALGDEDMISIATGHKQPIALAPAITTVITAHDIKEMGATELSDVLETVPGLHVSRRAVGYNPKFLIRGVETRFNPQILVLINGIPITNIFHGDRNQVWGGMPIAAIARVEIIRGPGSSIYGADAFAGVINIITKTKQDIPKPELGVRLGSFSDYRSLSSHEIWMLGAETWNGFDIAVMLEYFESDGADNIIEKDLQTSFDMETDTNVSLAPGEVNRGIKRLDTRLDISRWNWRLRAGLQKRWDGETGAGLAQALDPNGRFASDRWNVDLTYHNPELSEHWDVQGQFSFLDTSQEVEDNALLFPPGAVRGNLEFNDGLIGAPEVFERHYRFELSAFYTAFKNHYLRLGTGFTYSEIYNVIDVRNFGRGVDPIGTLADKSDTSESFLPEESRSNVYLFGQEEWRIANDWTLTLGLRYDHYSDFGNTIIPRLALIWATNYNLTTKLLYGQAFRAPAFAELFERNNPVALGNEDLDPETIDTVELAFDYRPRDDIRWDLNLFYYEWDDIIRFSPRAQNSGKQTGYGLELDTDWQLLPSLRFVGNYAFQRSEDENTDKDAGKAPHHQIYLRAEWEFLGDWTLSPQLNWVIDRERPPGDNRPDIDDYTVVDLTLRRRNVLNHLEFAVSVRNLFDEDAREPSRPGQPGQPAGIPNDLPLPERSLYVEVRLSF